MPKRIKTTVLMGDGSLLIECATQLIQREHSIKAIISISAGAWARENGIPVLDPNSDFRQALSDVEYDWFFSIANLRKVPGEVWRKAFQGAANFHDGPLPRYAGVNTPAWAILNGETEYGITWHRLTDGIDTGDVLLREPVAISDDDSALVLNTKCFEAGIVSFGRLVTQIEEGTLEGCPQDSSGRKFYRSVSAS